MLRKIASLVTAAALSVAVLPQQAVAEESTQILVDDVAVEAAAPFVYEQTTYVSLYHVSLALQPDATVGWEGDHAAVHAEGLEITAYPNAKYIQVNDRYLYLPYGVRIENDDTFVPVRVLARAFGAEVKWEPSDGNVYITSGTDAFLSGSEFYDADYLYWLSHIIYAESGNQPLDGKIAVGNVILNRISNPLFPNTMEGVVTQANQFTTIYSSNFNRDPNAESTIAAKLCLEGASVLPTALWFNRAGISCWASKHRNCVAVIGAHAFYE